LNGALVLAVLVGFLLTASVAEAVSVDRPRVALSVSPARLALAAPGSRRINVRNDGTDQAWGNLTLAMSQWQAGRKPEARATYPRANPMMRTGSPFDVAEACVYFAGPSGKFVTGENHGNTNRR
jgi:NAD(P)-dependent dehydrogenase (short-subunit alcohol dehydrogenase family)